MIWVYGLDIEEKVLKKINYVKHKKYKEGINILFWAEMRFLVWKKKKKELSVGVRHHCHAVLLLTNYLKGYIMKYPKLQII